MSMRAIVAFALLCAWQAVCVAGGAGPASKMSPWVRRASTQWHTNKLRTDTGAPPLLCAFVAISPDSIESVLVAEGCRVLDSRGGISIVLMPMDRLEHIAAHAAVRRIEASGPMALHMDTTATVVNATPIYSGEELPQAFDGSGVTVGVMDIGFDLTHPNFFDTSASRYRIAAMWDMLSTDTVGSHLHVGRDYVGREELLAHQRSADGHLQTHGTHTLGIAAGSGYDSPYRGMAPASDICLVSNAVTDDMELIATDDIYKYTSATDALGFKYLFDNAAQRGQPCVASLSEGAVPIYDQDDSLFSAYLGLLTGPGRIIVSSAGNECVRLNYVAKPRGTSMAGAFLVCYDQEAGFFVHTDEPVQLLMMSYGDMATDTVAIDLGQWPADSVLAVSAPIGAQGTNCMVTVERWPSAFGQPMDIYHVLITGSANLNRDNPLAVALRGAQAEAALRAYAPAMWANALADERWAQAEMSHNVNTPAYFQSVIAVGSTIHRTGFVNYLGTYYDYSQEGRNDGVRSYYSSVGPTMDGRTKPNVVAPGDNIVSSYSSYYEDHNPEARDILSDVAHFEHNGRTYAWNSNTGTSMAAPVVAGTIALWLQAKPSLTPAEVLQTMAATCRQPEEGMAYPNNLYGHGEIDAYRGLLHLLGIDGISHISMHQPQGTTIAPMSGHRLCLSFSAMPQRPIVLTLYSTSGAKMWQGTIGSSMVNQQLCAVVQLPTLPAGVYAVQADSPESGLGGSTLVRF